MPGTLRSLSVDDQPLLLLVSASDAAIVPADDRAPWASSATDAENLINSRIENSSGFILDAEDL
jgi:hypothetical protein